MVKTGEELRRMRVVAQASEKAIIDTLSAVTPGMNGFEMEAIAASSHYHSKVRHEYVGICIGPYGVKIFSPSERGIQIGEMVRLDMVGSYRFYHSDVSRVGVLGEPSSELLKVHRSLRKSLEAVVEAARPGITAERLYQIGSTVLKESGEENFLPSVGHGLGRDYHERPYLMADDETILETGMVLAVELVIAHEGLGFVALEDDIVITQDGNESLTTTGRDLYVINL